MNEDDNILDLDSLWAEDDTITITSNDTTVSLTDHAYTSPLSTSLSNGFTYSATLGTTMSNPISAGATLSTTNTGSLLWNNPSYTATASPYTVTTGGTLSAGNWLGNIHVGNHQPSLRVTGDAHFDGDITVQGVSLDERLTAIEERLGILRPNNDLEGKWEQLKALGDEYRKLEKEILEKEQMWDILKK
jgi:hypothetical protein